MDIGSWNALRTVCEADANNNIVNGAITLDSCSDVITLNRDRRKLTIKDTKGIIVVVASGWVLLCREDMAQAVKEVREQALKSSSPVVCEKCDVSTIKVSGTNSLRVAAVGLKKASVEFTTDSIVVT